MRNRIEILKDLVLLQDNIEILEKELSKFPWDSEIPLFLITTEDFTSVLNKALNDEIDFEVLTLWADTIECREDIEFKNKKIQEIVFELANPEINGDITKERLQKIINELQVSNQ